LRPVARLLVDGHWVDARAQLRELGLEVLLVRLHRHPADARARPPRLSPERAFERGLVDVMKQGGEPGMDGSSSQAFTRAR
jgi:hypothetical protein